ncbi:PAS domain-containing methyl-accepting chemotaxis protein [Allorhizobium sp. BGMRC 0089]|uniref:methyl-accepting chemotaxis protein n=1 Tax=Allorhizobium sonneratiae TaxID=2934936 RepID=UPI0020346329|nr:PAS domain-containing methyl-accepting chemotaxis protein [Allorhizobium sonneratiae]MCM2292797.1 PAS domain-containing methyl-accepting chemotaxis protein [Allorhizobium sonneratiae]
MSLLTLRGDAQAEVDAMRRSQAVIEFTLDGIILDANENFCKALGYSLLEIKGKHHSIFVDPVEAKQPEYKLFWDNLRAGKFDRRQYRRIAKDGHDVWIEASYNPLLKGGKPYKVVKYATDITAAKLKALEDDAKLKALSASQALIEFASDGTILTANENFCTALGYQLSEISGRHHRMFCDPAYVKTSAYEDFWARLARGEVAAGEFCRIGKAGNDVWIQASYNPVFDSRGKVYKIVKIATDVSSRMNAISEISRALRALSAGDLTIALDKPLVPTMEALRHDFNDTITGLRSIIQNLMASADNLTSSAGELSIASTDLAKRTERQAASLEETAAAMEEVTNTIKDSSQRAANVGRLVEDMRAHAAHSGHVVQDAVSAMSAIEQSSRQISSILGVIDEIAFQTNLLALNAGVEAARAGEAGKGFAVVAQEVRELAQRSASAAREIRQLIGTSAAQVEHGVELVANTGQSLEKIVAQVQQVSENINVIIHSASEQSGSLGEINTSVNVIDQETQKNAALVEELTATTVMVGETVDALHAVITRFHLSEAAQQVRHGRAA